MTNFERLISDKEKLAGVLISSPEFESAMADWWCNGKRCPLAHDCGETCMDETSYVDVTMMWFESEYDEDEEET